jgi:hypothetical protein
MSAGHAGDVENVREIATERKREAVIARLDFLSRWLDPFSNLVEIAALFNCQVALNGYVLLNNKRTEGERAALDRDEDKAPGTQAEFSQQVEACIAGNPYMGINGEYLDPLRVVDETRAREARALQAKIAAMIGITREPRDRISFLIPYIIVACYHLAETVLDVLRQQINVPDKGKPRAQITCLEAHAISMVGMTGCCCVAASMCPFFCPCATLALLHTAETISRSEAIRQGGSPNEVIRVITAEPLARGALRCDLRQV